MERREYAALEGFIDAYSLAEPRFARDPLRLAWPCEQGGKQCPSLSYADIYKVVAAGR